MKLPGAATLPPGYDHYPEMTAALEKMFPRGDTPWHERLPGNRNTIDNIEIEPPNEREPMNANKFAIASMLGGMPPNTARESQEGRGGSRGMGMPRFDMGAPSGRMGMQQMPMPMMMPPMDMSAGAGSEPMGISMDTPQAQQTQAQQAQPMPLPVPVDTQSQPQAGGGLNPTGFDPAFQMDDEMRRLQMLNMQAPVAGRGDLG